MAHGFSYEDAWNMSYRDYGRYSCIAAAWSIPPDEREQSVRKGTRADQHLLL
jgi:hypothetical protein